MSSFGELFVPVKDFDPLEYIENAFLDVRKPTAQPSISVSDLAVVHSEDNSE